jgi:quinol-cytochrome oxidoreductase complex cytochrome b subunit
MDPIVMFMLGFVGGVIVTAIALRFMLNGKTKHINTNHVAMVALGAFVAAMFVLPALGVHAQETIDVPTDVIFEEANTWIVTFAPIAAIGIGITIALAVLGYIGKMIAQAFR